MAVFGSPWLRQAIESVCAQTFKSWELLILDDANLDSTCDVVEAIGDGRIRYLPNDSPLRPALNHRRGVELASYGLIACINHDDVWEPTMLAELTVPLLAEPEAVVSFGDHWVIDESGNIDSAASDAMSSSWGRSELRRGVYDSFDRIAVINQTIPIAQCAVWRKSAVGMIPGWAGDRYDYWLQVALAMSGGKAIYVHKRLASFRVHSGNLSRDGSWQRRIDGVRFFNHLLASYDFAPDVRSHLRRRRRTAITHAAKWPAWQVTRALSHR
jgi:glycosyltransferase involved in cell wall biosynthesis